MSTTTETYKAKIAEQHKQTESLHQDLLKQIAHHESEIRDLRALVEQLHGPVKASKPAKAAKPAGASPKVRVLEAITATPWMRLDAIQKSLPDLDPAAVKATVRGLTTAKRIKIDTMAEPPTFALYTHADAEHDAAVAKSMTPKPNGKTNGASATA